MKKIITIIILSTLMIGSKFIDHTIYKNDLINKYGQSTYELMNIEAGINSESESFIYYLVNNA